jgi:hypothetical protein
MAVFQKTLIFVVGNTVDHLDRYLTAQNNYNDVASLAELVVAST